MCMLTFVYWGVWAMLQWFVPVVWSLIGLCIGFTHGSACCLRGRDTLGYLLSMELSILLHRGALQPDLIVDFFWGAASLDLMVFSCIAVAVDTGSVWQSILGLDFVCACGGGNRKVYLSLMEHFPAKRPQGGW